MAIWEGVPQLNYHDYQPLTSVTRPGMIHPPSGFRWRLAWPILYLQQFVVQLFFGTMFVGFDFLHATMHARKEERNFLGPFYHWSSNHLGKMAKYKSACLLYVFFPCFFQVFHVSQTFSVSLVKVCIFLMGCCDSHCECFSCRQWAELPGKNGAILHWKTLGPGFLLRVNVTFFGMVSEILCPFLNGCKRDQPNVWGWSSVTAAESPKATLQWKPGGEQHGRNECVMRWYLGVPKWVGVWMLNLNLGGSRNASFCLEPKVNWRLR